MRIKYTKRVSGYFALILGIITTKVFIEALLLGRGPIPGLSFLFYTMIFYTHYIIDEIEKKSLTYYKKIRTIVTEFDLKSIPKPEIIVLQINKIMQLVINKIHNLNVMFLDKIEYNRTKHDLLLMTKNLRNYLKQNFIVTETRINNLYDDLKPSLTKVTVQVKYKKQDLQKNVSLLFLDIQEKWDTLKG